MSEEQGSYSDNHHDDLLKSGAAPRDILEEYFSELEAFMEKNNFGGCPFTNRAQAVRGKSEAGIQSRVKGHKTEVRSFFRKLCEKGSFQPRMLSEVSHFRWSIWRLLAAWNADFSPLGLKCSQAQGRTKVRVPFRDPAADFPGNLNLNYRGFLGSCLWFSSLSS